MAIDPARAARERKQKIFVVVGGVVLLGLLAFQLPRLLGGSESPSAAPAQETTVEGVDVPTPPVTASSQPAVLVDTDRPHAPQPGKLRSFSIFSKKDPFEQQVSTSASSDAAAPAPASGVGVSQGQGQGQPPSKGFAPNQTPATTMTVISVNGARQVLEPGTAFPSADPVFVLVAEQPGSKSVVIGIAGGAYSSGAKTTKLKVGRPLVLVNTTTRARYRLVLVAVGAGDAGSTPTP